MLDQRQMFCAGGPRLVVPSINMRRWPTAGLMLGQRQQQWASVKLAVGQRLVFTG